MEVQVFSAAPINMEEIIIKKDDDNSNKSIQLVTDYLDKSILKPNNISHPKSRIDFLNIIKE